MEILDWLIFIAFIVYALASGWCSRTVSSQNLEEYFLAGRSLSGWSAGFSMAATQFAADTPLLVTGLVATRGVFSLWQLWVFVFAFFMFSYLLSPCWRNALVITDAELTQKRYEKELAFTLRVLKAFYFGIIFNCLVLAWVFLAATKIAEPYLLWNEWLPAVIYDPFFSIVKDWGLTFATGEISSIEKQLLLSTNNIFSITAILLVTLFYSTLGGLRAVVRTDMVQLAIMFLATVVFGWYLVDHLGGMANLIESVKTLYPEEKSFNYNKILSFDWSYHSDLEFSFLLLLCLQWIVQVNSDGTGYLAQRAMACRTDLESKKAGVVFAITQVLIRSLLWLPIAIGLLVFFPLVEGADSTNLNLFREKTYILGMNEVLPVGFLGLMFTALFAALTSTVDSHLNWGASYLTNDLVKGWLGKRVLKKEFAPSTLVWVARASNLVILVIAIIFCSNLNSIQDAWQISLMLGSGVGVILVLRWFWWRISALTEVVAIVSSFIFSIIVYLNVEDPSARILLVGLLSTVFSLFFIKTKSTRQLPVIKEFYKTVQPPGLWPEHVTGCPNSTINSRKKLIRGLLATFFSGMSLCLLLAGFGGLLIDSPAPNGWAIQAGLWNSLLALIGAFLIYPSWLYGFKGSQAGRVSD